jgi:GT2 family glycosyltransferase
MVETSEVVESGIRIDWATGLVYGVAQTISNKISYYKNMDVVGDLDALPGKGTLVPVDVFKKGVNFKYKLLPHYIADYEFAINAKNHGFDLLVCTNAIAKHFWEATGISAKATETRKSYIRAFQILFGRKSMNNIIDLLRFVYLSCPKEYKLRNYYYTFLKLVKHGLTIFPFYYLLPIFPILSKLRHFIRVKAYIIQTKITQFPEYHLRKK